MYILVNMYVYIYMYMNSMIPGSLPDDSTFFSTWWSPMSSTSSPMMARNASRQFHGPRTFNHTYIYT